MFARSAIGSVIFLTCVSCLLAGFFIRIAIVKKINLRLSAEQRLSYFASGLRSELHLRSEYRRLYADGKMYFLMETLVALAIACDLFYLIFF